MTSPQGRDARVYFRLEMCYPRHQAKIVSEKSWLDVARLFRLSAFAVEKCHEYQPGAL